MKTVEWLESSLDDLRRFPKQAMRKAGYELDQVQLGLEPSDWKPMPSIAPGVNEIRIHAGTEHRVIYTARFAEHVYVLHAFDKKTQKTPKRDIELAKRRYKRLVEIRKAKGLL